MKLKIKKGFTLAEILGIIIILGVITLIAFPLINKMIKDSKLDAYDAQVKTIIEAARTWAVNNPNRLPEINSTKEEFVSVLELISTGYLKDMNDNKIVNPMDETKTMDGCVEINYSETYNQYVYDYNEDCVAKEEVNDLIVFNGNENDKVLIGNEYKDLGVSVTDKYKDEQVNIITEIFYEGELVDKINTNSFKVYQIKYYATSGKYEQTLIRNVEVYDDIAPVIMVNGKTENQTITLELNSEFTVPEAVVTDNSVFEGSPYITTVNVDNKLNVGQEGTYQIIYTAYDYKGNSSTLTLEVKVIKVYFSISVEQTAGGTISVSKNTAKKGETVTISAAPSSNYMYSGATVLNTKGETVMNLLGNQTSIQVPDFDIIIRPSWMIAPEITKQPSDVSVNYVVNSAASSATFEVAVNNVPGATYQWYKTTNTTATGGTPISGATGRIYTIAKESISPAIHKTYYYCEIRLPSGAILTSRAAKLSVPYYFMSGCVTASTGAYSENSRTSSSYNLNTYFTNYRYTNLHANSSGAYNDSCSGTNECGANCNGSAGGIAQANIGGQTTNFNGNLNLNISGYSNKTVYFYVYARASGTCHSGCSCYDLTWKTSVCSAYID